MDKVNSDGIEQAAVKYSESYGEQLAFKAGAEWQQSQTEINPETGKPYFSNITPEVFNKEFQPQPEHTQSEIIAGYIHEIDSLRETNRKLGEQKGNNDSDAVEFAFWVNSSKEAGDYQREHRIEPDMGGKYIEGFKKQYEELYKLFKQSKL